MLVTIIHASDVLPMRACYSCQSLTHNNYILNLEHNFALARTCCPKPNPGYEDLAKKQ